MRGLRNHGLSIVLFLLFAVFIGGQAAAGYRADNQDKREHREPPGTFWEYVTGGEFAESVFENWESEFLAVWAIVLLSIVLRQCGSPQSKPVHAPHSQTGG
jgi:hypothetical protein